MVNVNKCHRCGSAAFTQQAGALHWVECGSGSCAIGPAKKTQDEAVEEWNKLGNKNNGSLK